LTPLQLSLLVVFSTGFEVLLKENCFSKTSKTSRIFTFVFMVLFSELFCNNTQNVMKNTNKDKLFFLFLLFPIFKVLDMGYEII